MPLRAAVLALALLSLTTVAARTAQEPQAAQPTFRSTVDLVPVDVNVIDKDGRPVSDLAAGDFTLSVDGKPRRIASAQFISVTRSLETPPPQPREYDSNSGAAGGRLVMLVIDSGNIAAGRGRPAIEAAKRFVGSLNPADRVALVTIPGAGPQIDFTSNRAIVQTLLDKVVGQATEPIGPRKVGIYEALAFERNDQSTIDTVVDRECSAYPTVSIRETCQQQLAGEAEQLLSFSRERTRNSLIALRYLFERVSSSETPKTIVFLSEGLLLNRDNADIAWVGPRAASAHIILYVLQLDSPEMEAGQRTTSPSRSEDREVLRQGLDQLAGMARGDVFRIVANADFAFQRLALELSGYYLLSFEPQPGDRDGKPHKIRIDVRRKDLMLRSRREFSVGAAAARTAEDTVLETLRAPLLASDIPLKLTTYTFQDPDSAKLKIILVADIDRSLNPEDKVSLGYLMFDDKGKLITSQLEKDLANPVDRLRKTQKYVGAAMAGPGTYTLKVAVVDSSGKRGSVERTFNARLNGFGQLHVTDLLIADDSVRGADGLPPAVAADFTGDELHGYVELFSEAPEQLKNATVVIEVAQNETARALDSTPARFQLQGDRRRVAEAGVPIALLPPGDYVARAVVMVGGKKVGQVARPFRVTRPAATIASPGAGTVPMRAAAPIAFTSKIDAFDKSSVLAPQVVGFFLDRLSAAAASSAATVRPAVDSVRAGKFDEAMDALKSTPDDQLAAVFLKGLVLFHRGDLNGAAAKFRDALRMDSEFYSAAFYLGACYAAGGKDREAAGAWQTSLITESNASFVYTLLGDALLRLRDMDQAIDVLTEARTLWPNDDQVTLRLGTALVLANKPAEAMKVLDPYLTGHPADTDRLYLALRALYEARSSGRTLTSADADRALFGRYADAYAAAKGPQLALVEQWRKVIEK
ncbi:MAG TPA: VWA domain-containing protein [Vicinamibacterales bacterium]|nr:VWA domain-containing protein [Vicinamibacterales bacterium]